MKLITTLLVLLMTTQSLAQDGCDNKITGQVIAMDTKKPLPFATVKVLETKTGVITDAEGHFVLTDICENEIDLEARFLGYKTVIHHHDFYKSDKSNKNHIFYLSPKEDVLESVVVEGESIVGDLQSISVEKINRAQLETKTTTSLASAISEIQGVTFSSVGSNVQLPVIHGLYGNRILIINNGVKHGFQNWGSDHAPEIDITSANNISVLKGASGVRYGPEALGGVVVVDGNPLQLSKKLYGSINSGFQTNGRGYHANANLGAGYKRFSYHIGGNYVRLGDRHSPDYSLTNTGREERSANLGFRYHLPKWDFELYYSYVDQELGVLRASIANSPDSLSSAFTAARPDDVFIKDFSYDINEPKQNTTHHLAKIEIDWRTDLGRIALLLSQQINLRKEFDVRRGSDAPIIDLQLNTVDTRLEWDHPVIIGMQGTFGIQYFSQNNDNNPGTNTTAFIPNYNTNRFSAYVIESLQKGKNTYELGLRLDQEYNSARGREQSQNIFRNEFSFTNFTASLGWVRDLSQKWQLRSNVGSAWRPPNMAELYSFGQHGFQVQYGLWRHYFDENGTLRTNRILTEEDEAAESEKGYKWINELSYKDDVNRLIFTAYTHYIENFIFVRPIGVNGTVRGPRPAFVFDQANALFAGTDITYSRTITEKLRTKVGTSYLWNLNVEDNESLINQPPLNINAELTWETPALASMSRSKLTLRTSYTFEQYQAPPTITPEQIISGQVQVTSESEIFDFRDAPGGYFLAHLLYEVKIGRFGGQFSVRNVFNSSYRDYLNQMRYFADELGRNFTVQINYSF